MSPDAATVVADATAVPGGLSLDDLAERVNAEQQQRAAAPGAEAAFPHMLAMGALLIEAKKQVPRRTWGDWVARHCDVDLRTAQVAMKVARDLPTRLQTRPAARRSPLTLNRALKLLAARRRHLVQ